MTRISATVRQRVRERAHRRCEYCHKPEAVSTYGFHVDHILPLLHGGTPDENNLAWACLECNVGKGRDIASYDPVTQQLTPLFHPRRDHWQDHFQLQDAVIHGLTPTGRVTVRILALNDPDQIDTRALLIAAGLW